MSRFLIVFAVVLLVAGCGDDEKTDTDTMADTTGDTAVDTPGDGTPDIPGDQPNADMPDVQVDLTGSMFNVQYRAALETLEAAFQGFCTCAGDSESGYCRANPTDCFGSVPLCVENTTIAYGEALIVCMVGVLDANAAEASGLLGCQDTALSTFTACITGSMCDAMPVETCNQAYVTSMEACIDVAPAVDAGFQTCFEESMP